MLFEHTRGGIVCSVIVINIELLRTVSYNVSGSWIWVTTDVTAGGAGAGAGAGAV